jgi:hypothetical protein
MKAIIIGMVIYCVTCVLLLLGVSLYRELQHDHDLSSPGDEIPPAPPAEYLKAAALQAQTPKSEKQSPPSARRAA